MNEKEYSKALEHLGLETYDPPNYPWKITLEIPVKTEQPKPVNTCFSCGGKGKRKYKRYRPILAWGIRSTEEYYKKETCHVCNGLGKYDYLPSCNVCFGRKKYRVIVNGETKVRDCEICEIKK